MRKLGKLYNTILFRYIYNKFKDIDINYICILQHTYKIIFYNLYELRITVSYYINKIQCLNVFEQIEVNIMSIL